MSAEDEILLIQALVDLKKWKDITFQLSSV